MSSIERNPVQSNARRQNIEGNQRHNSSDLSPSTPASFQETVRARMWILRILIILFVLQRNLNPGLAMPGDKWKNFYYEAKKDPSLGRKVIVLGHEEKDGVAKEFDHFKLNLVWQFTACAKVYERLQKEPEIQEQEYKECTQKGKVFFRNYGDQFFKFTIHGLWPGSERLANSDKDVQTVDCDLNKKKYDENIRNLPNITKYWPSFVQAEETFWQAEWKKHGTCAAFLKDMTSCMQYFKKALELTEKLDGILEAFKKKYNGRSDEDEEKKIGYNDLKDFFEEKGYDKKITINGHKFLGLPFLKDDQRRIGFRKEHWIESLTFCFDLSFEKIDCKEHVTDFLILPAQFSLKRLRSDDRKRHLLN